MNCLGPERIYSYLDGLLPAEEARRVEDHLASCALCRDALEERRLLARAAESLPPLELPADFTLRVMAAVLPQQVSLRSWLTGFAVWLFTIFISLGVLAIATGERGGSFLMSLNQAAWHGLKNASLLFARFAALLVVTGRIVRSAGGLLVKGVLFLTSLLSPGVQAAAIALSLTFLAGLWFLLRKRRPIGEKT